MKNEFGRNTWGRKGVIQSFGHGVSEGKGDGQKEGQEGEQPDACREAGPQPAPFLAGLPADGILDEMIKMAHSRWTFLNTN